MNIISEHLPYQHQEAQLPAHLEKLGNRLWDKVCQSGILSLLLTDITTLVPVAHQN